MDTIVGNVLRSEGEEFDIGIKNTICSEVRLLFSISGHTLLDCVVLCVALGVVGCWGFGCGRALYAVADTKVEVMY